jgi:hypothetical protein
VFTTPATFPPSISTWTETPYGIIRFANGHFYSSNLSRSSDLSTWTTLTGGSGGSIVAYGNGQYAAFKPNSTSWSNDGLTWTSYYNSYGGIWNEAYWLEYVPSASLFVGFAQRFIGGLGSRNVIFTTSTPSANTWVEAANTADDWRYMKLVNGKLILAGTEGQIGTYTVGSSSFPSFSQVIPIISTERIVSITYGNGVYVACTHEGSLIYRLDDAGFPFFPQDGWSFCVFNNSDPMIDLYVNFGVTFVNGRFIALGGYDSLQYNGQPYVYTSVDGINWSGESVPITLRQNSIYAGDLYIGNNLLIGGATMAAGSIYTTLS